MSYGCQQDKLKLDRFEQRVIEYLCRQANSLSNCAIYALKRSSRQANQVDYNYYDLDKHLKQNRHYKCLFSQVAQTCFDFRVRIVQIPSRSDAALVSR